MITTETARQMALDLQGTEEYNHFGKPAFRANKRTFSTLWIPERRMMVKLSLIDQSVFHTYDPTIFYPVPNKWGLQGCTFVDLDKVRPEMLEDVLNLAWQETALKGKGGKAKG